MACNSCSRKKNSNSVNRRDSAVNSIMNEFKYMTDRQIKARLEVFKKRFCQGCGKRYECDYQMYTDCNKK